MDEAEEAFNLEMAATYAATPPLDASEGTKHYLEACLAVIQEAFVAINNAIDTPTPKRMKCKTSKLVEHYKRAAREQFLLAFHTEEAHLVDSLRHLQARDIPTPKNYNEAIESTFQEYWNEAIAQEITT